jgi:hypothetical protein
MTVRPHSDVQRDRSHCTLCLPVTYLRRALALTGPWQIPATAGNISPSAEEGQPSHRLEYPPQSAVRAFGQF